MSQTRQLAAIMFTDIVGYTALMGKDSLDLNKNWNEIEKNLFESDTVISKLKCSKKIIGPQLIKMNIDKLKSCF